MDHLRRAGWGARVGAALLDALIVWGIVLVLLFVAAVASFVTGHGGLDKPLPLLIVLLTAAAYYLGTMTRPGEANGQTLGKQAAGIRVVRDDGRPLTAGTIAA